MGQVSGVGGEKKKEQKNGLFQISYDLYIKCYYFYSGEEKKNS